MATSPLPAFRVDPEPPERFSMSFMRAAGGCLRRAHHERLADIAGYDAQLGRVFHEVIATVGTVVLMRGDTRPRDGEVAQLARRVMANPERVGPLPRQLWEDVLELADRWEPIAVFKEGERFEVSMRHALPNGYVASARIDRLWISDDERVAEVIDAKTGWGDVIEGPTPQGDMYSWHVVQAVPTIEVVRFHQEHARFGFRQPRPYEYDRDQIALVEEWMVDASESILHAYEQGGELPTSPGEACEQWGGCPVARDCPVPRWARPATEITTDEEAVEQLEVIAVESAATAERKKAIRGYLERTGRRAIVHNGIEVGFAEDAGTQTDWKGLAQSLGGDPAEFTKDKPPSFGKRKAKKAKEGS